jgi:hypothetical protein
MTKTPAGPARVYAEKDEVSLFALANVLLRWRWTIVALGIIGGVIGLAMGLTTTRMYVSAATFIPQGSEGGGTSSLALAASQFGIRVPTTSTGWGPPVYVELLRSRALLEPLALDTLVVAEKGGRRLAFKDLLEIKAPTPPQQTDAAVRALVGMVTASEIKTLGAVKVSVTTPWPSVSLSLAQKLVRGVNVFNLETRKSQAAAERQFVEVQAAEAERALRAAEDRLQYFLQGNRAIAGQLGFERDRLQREVALRQQVYTSLLQSREEAKIREVRDTPVITVLENPRLPVVGESRRVAQKTVVGGLTGAMLGVLIAFLAQGVSGARKAPSEEASEFFQLVSDATPRFLRRVRR